MNHTYIIKTDHSTELAENVTGRFEITSSKPLLHSWIREFMQLWFPKCRVLGIRKKAVSVD